MNTATFSQTVLLISALLLYALQILNNHRFDAATAKRLKEHQKVGQDIIANMKACTAILIKERHRLPGDEWKDGT